MTNSFQMAKTEMVVLFELIDWENLIIGISELPSISEGEFEEIKRFFVDNGYILIKNEKAIPCKDLEKFLTYIDRAERILLFKQGGLSGFDFSATIYFSSKGIVAVQELDDKNVEFIMIESLEELMIFIPGFGEVDEEHKQYLSYRMIDNETMIIHFAGLEEEGKMVKVFETKQDNGGIVSEEETYVKFQTYTELFQSKMKEVYDVSCG